MKKKIVILMIVLALICTFVFLASKMLDRGNYEEYTNSNTEWEDSAGGLIQKQEGFVFQFTNQQDFENAVSSEMVEAMCKTDNEVLLYGEWKFISYDGEYVIAQDNMGTNYQIKISKDSVSVAGSY